MTKQGKEYYSSKLQEAIEAVNYTWVSGEYVNSQTHVEVQCDKGHEPYWVMPNNFIQGKHCRKCSFKKTGDGLRFNTEKFKKEVYEREGTNYTVLGEYEGSGKPILMRHEECGSEFNFSRDVFLRGSRCPKCMRPNYNRDTNHYKKEVFELVGDEYTVLEEYVYSIEPLKMKHSKCKKCFYMTPSKFLSGQRCPNCYHSKGEEAVKKFLNKNKIHYDTEYTYEDLRDVNVLRYDFYVPEYNLLIEFDGIQHFKPKNFGGVSKEEAEKEFKAIQYRDTLKNKYAEENSINLLRIPYWDIDKVDFLISQTINRMEVS